MIYEELIEDGTRIRHYSDMYMIEQAETGHIYEDAVDYIPCKYTYRETDIPLPEPEPMAEQSDNK